MQPNEALRKMMADITRTSGRDPEKQEALRARPPQVAPVLPPGPAVPEGFTLTPASKPGDNPAKNFWRNVGFFLSSGVHTMGSSFMDGVGDYVSPDRPEAITEDEQLDKMMRQIEIDEAAYKAREQKQVDSVQQDLTGKPMHQVVGEHQEALRKDAAKIDLDAMSDLTPKSLQDDISTISRATGASDLGGAMDAMSKASPNAFQDIAKNLKEISGFDGPVNEAVKRGQEMLELYTKQGIGRLNDVNAGETERWRQLQSKLQGGPGMSGKDKLGFAMMAMIPLLARMFNKRARVDLAYGNLAKAYAQTEAQRKQEYSDTLREYDMISDNVRQGSIQLGQAVNQYIQGDTMLAKALEDSSMNIYKLAEAPGSEMDSKSLVENYLQMRQGSGLADVSKFDQAEREAIGTRITLRPLLTKMSSLEDQIMNKVKTGQLSGATMDNVLKFFTRIDNGVFALPDRLKEHLSRYAPELIQYQQVANQAVAMYVRGFSGAAATDAEREFISKFVALGGYASPETLQSLQQIRRNAYNSDLMKLSPAARQRARIDHMVVQLGGDEKVRKFIKNLGGTVDLQNGTVTNVKVNIGGQEKYVKGLPIEDFFYMMQQNDPRFKALQLQLTFEE